MWKPLLVTFLLVREALACSPLPGIPYGPFFHVYPGSPSSPVIKTSPSNPNVLFGTLKLYPGETYQPMTMDVTIDIASGRVTSGWMADAPLSPPPMLSNNPTGAYELRQLTETRYALLGPTGSSMEFDLLFPPEGYALSSESVYYFVSLEMNLAFLFYEGNIDGCNNCRTEFYMSIDLATGNVVRAESFVSPRGIALFTPGKYNSLETVYESPVNVASLGALDSCGGTGWLRYYADGSVASTSRFDPGLVEAVVDVDTLVAYQVYQSNKVTFEGADSTRYVEDFRLRRINMVSGEILDEIDLSNQDLWALADVPPPDTVVLVPPSPTPPIIVPNTNAPTASSASRTTPGGSIVPFPPFPVPTPPQNAPIVVPTRPTGNVVPVVFGPVSPPSNSVPVVFGPVGFLPTTVPPVALVDPIDAPFPPSPQPMAPSLQFAPVVVPTTDPPVPVVTPTDPPVPVAAPTNPPVPVVTPTNPPVPVVTPTNPPVPVVVPTNPPAPVVAPTNPPVPVPTNPPAPVVTPTNPPAPVVVPTNPPVPFVDPTETSALVPAAVPVPMPVSAPTEEPVLTSPPVDGRLDPTVTNTTTTPIDENSFPLMLPQCNAHDSCSALAGECCPTTDSVLLTCCGQGQVELTCQENAKCDAMGLADACCPTVTGVYLDCCEVVPDECGDDESDSCVVYSALQYMADLESAQQRSRATRESVSWLMVAVAMVSLLWR